MTFDFWIPLIFFQKNLDTREIIEDKISADDADEFNRIRCPQCKWQPKKTSRWYCSSAGAPEFFFGGCGAVWNTFDTRGKCPGCAHQWRWTTCLSCHANSLHEDWYVKDGE